ncbi:uncharacterized protein LOC122724830 [Manihot esculenta]|uniref:uncharacterized protein LOC122724830 n=1 Tax=Manihot esculenta TaxID=3983 RepID=UPI001CC81D5E|nr:uncharacterized protein LOC122724830 [Manihot esculenta]
MGRKKNKQKKIKSSSSSTKALSKHSEELNKSTIKPVEPSKTTKIQEKTSEDLKKWIEELSQSLEVIKALQDIASSSGESVIVKRHKVKWWGSFKNSTTELVVKQRILKKAQFPAISYASKLALQGESSFGAQKAQCQAMLSSAKTSEEYKMICQQMFSQLGSGETIKSEEIKQERKSSSKESSKHSSSKKALKKKSSKRKPKKQSSSESESTASSTSSSSKTSASSYCDSNEDDCYGILPAIRIKSKTDKVKEKGKKK